MAVGDSLRTIVNHNKLLKKYDGAIGVKTGYTKRCGRCLVGAAERDGIRLISVTLDAPDDWNDHISMLDYGFSLLEATRIEDLAPNLIQLPVIGGVSNSIKLELNKTSRPIVKLHNEKLEASFSLPQYLVAPIEKDAQVGELIIKREGKIIARIAVKAAEDVMADRPRGLFDILFN